MWAIRILNGSQAGQLFPLHGGKHRLGRGSLCEIKINSNSVSKEHAAILVTGDKIILTDSNSRNGTFVNGVRVQNQRLDQGDKISLHDVLLDILRVPDNMRLDHPMAPSANGMYTAPAPQWAGNAALQVQNHSQPQYNHAPAHYDPAHAHQQQQMHAAHDQGHAGEAPQLQVQPNSINGLLYNLKIYIDAVAMPGVYTLVHNFQFRHALGILVAIYVVIVTALSTIPVVNTTKQNIKAESIRRAKTIARNMAATNRQAVIQNNEVGMSVRQAELEEGVTTAVIITAKDGTILAPANKRGEYVDKAFIQSARRDEKEKAEFIDDSNLGVSVPITLYSADSGNQTVIAYAVILYDMGSLAINATQTFSLFMQTLAIALLVGAFLYFFLFKIVENPIEALNAQVDDALREGRDDVATDYTYPALDRLISNINSALSRIDRSGGEQVNVVVNRDTEAINMLGLMPLAAIVVNAIDERVIAANAAFDRLIGGGVNLAGQPLTSIPDVALQENLRDLIPRMRANVSEIALGEIPFQGSKYLISGQAIMANSEPAYYFLTIASQENN